MSAYTPLNRAIVDAVRAALDAAGKEDVQIKQSIPGAPIQEDLVVMLSADEASDRNTKLSYHSANAQNVRCYSEYELGASNLADIVVGVAKQGKVDLRPYGFKIKDGLSYSRRNLDRTTDTGDKYSQIVRLEGNCQPIS